MRIQLSKKIRFDIFKRDGFICQYCGNTPPKVVLEVDHIIPVCKGGTNSIDNLISACFDCNRGKSGNELTAIPKTTIEKTESLLEKELQYKAFRKIQKKIEDRINKEAEEVNSIYSSYSRGRVLTDKFINSSLKPFLKKLGFQEVSEAMHKSCSKINSYKEQSIKYFCAICWNKIREGNNGHV